MGRPAKPTKIKIYEGNPGKRPLNENEPTPSNEMPRCPAWMNKVAKDTWKRLAKELNRIGLLTKIDGDVLAAYCQVYSRWRDAEEKLMEAGKQIQSTTNGYLCADPYVNIASNCLNLMHKYIRELGLSPSARTQLQVNLTDETKKDVWDGLLTNVG